MTKNLKSYVVIATKGRPNDVPNIRDQLLSQTVIADRIIFVGTENADFGKIDNDNVGVEFAISEKPGLTSQRNYGIERVLDIHGNSDDFVVFYFDDDFRPSLQWIENALEHFKKKALCGLTGDVLADGILGPGLTEEKAQQLLKTCPIPDPQKGGALCYEKNVSNLYGCNMAYSGKVSRHLRFDESFPAYGWLEDKDYSRRAEKYGRVVAVTNCQGVHLGTKSWRTSGVKFGYSQISNPLYLLRKGTMGALETGDMVARNLLANHIKMLKPEPWVDRKGRAKGNWRAIADLIRGRLTPQRINEF